MEPPHFLLYHTSSEIIILDITCRTRSGHAAQATACPSLFSNWIDAFARMGESRGTIPLFSDRHLDFRQPLALILLVPDPVDIALPDLTGDLVPVFLDMPQHGFVGFRKCPVGTPVKNAGRLNFREGFEPQPAGGFLP